MSVFLSCSLSYFWGRVSQWPCSLMSPLDWLATSPTSIPVSAMPAQRLQRCITMPRLYIDSVVWTHDCRERTSQPQLWPHPRMFSIKPNSHMHAINVSLKMRIFYTVQCSVTPTSLQWRSRIWGAEAYTNKGSCSCRVLSRGRKWERGSQLSLDVISHRYQHLEFW